MTKPQIEASVDQSLKGSLLTFRDFLALPNDGGYPEQIDANLRWCDKAFTDLGFETQKIVSRGVSHLYAQKVIDPNKKSVLFYLQIDGQPVDSSAWNQPSPFRAVIKDKNGKLVDWKSLDTAIDPDDKIFARSASDSKGPASCFMTALKIMQEKGVAADFNIKVIMDFQEEMSSPTIAQLVQDHRELLAADRLLIMDGTRHISNLPTLTFGARGIATITLTVFGAKENLHSGQYGNYAPNPAFALARILASMKDKDGRVLIDGFYEGIKISDADKKIFAAIPEDLPELDQRLGINQAEKVGETYEESMQFPSLNVRGMRSGWVGKEVRTIIPSTAVAEIDIRLVPETEGQRMVDLVRKHIEAQGVTLTRSVPTDAERAKYPLLASFDYRIGTKPFRTDIDSDIGHWLDKAMTRAVEKHVNIRATGGSQPMATFIETLELPAVSIRIPNPDNNIHGPNENIRIGNFREGIKMCLAVLTEKL
ncbi:hypothetical protein GCM10007390_15180 [Persicitalea jodogahamensis]|uniref:Peptidase M20 dimerisation domain-containing protein n=2 Tax=Persicitalea jodogahamensis TaxID=402147 RepID=A0A8J3G9D0_9BACT|nr:hypothetical protein GCM10007390_15180 [Persicitalea jodogahamensis]